MDGYWSTLLLVGALIVLNALFAGSEIALISLREGQVRRLGRSDRASAARLVRLVEDPNRFLATIQIGITLAGFLASATAAVALAEPLVPALGFAGRAAEPLAIGLVTLVLTFATLVAGELAPKRLAMQYAERWALLAATPLDVLATASRPVVWALSRTTDLLVRLFGGDPRETEEPPSAEELRDMVVGHRGLTAEQRTIISGALEIHERPLRAVLIPRRQVFTLPDGTPAAQARVDLARSGHSRAPVVRAGHVDEVVGIVHLRDLITADDGSSVAALVHPVPFYSDFMKVSEALRRLMAARQQFAVVVDEHGSVGGIVTVEDLLEEIVGEIYDETDRDVSAVRAQRDGTLLLPGGFPVHDLPDLGVDVGDLAHGPYTTVAGLVLARLGHLPQRPGESVRLGDWSVEITGVDRHAVTTVRLRPLRR
ncbi:MULTISPECIES: hemolysin family protein [unclassified Streptomyces]|uniref:hemolysin family protein n=1 Tax=unclassified Streptomyces TaxID=2593676 RepID=UPI0008DDF1B9|nr:MULTISPECIES: hemolysin family protein [unclassified Streptomyces]OII68378.1 hemolysin [Streptomyces sp. CC77]